MKKNSLCHAFSYVGYGMQLACATTILLAPHYAFAQDNVTLYGLIDEFAQYVNTGNGYTAALGSSGQWGSRFGLKGSEDIGGGQKVIFDLENGFNPNDGTLAESNSMFNRQAWVGLSLGSVGAGAAGRQKFSAVLRPERAGRVRRRDSGIRHG